MAGVDHKSPQKPQLNSDTKGRHKEGRSAAGFGTRLNVAQAERREETPRMPSSSHYHANTTGSLDHGSSVEPHSSALGEEQEELLPSRTSPAATNYLENHGLGLP